MRHSIFLLTCALAVSACNGPSNSGNSASQKSDRQSDSLPADDPLASRIAAINDATPAPASNGPQGGPAKNAAPDPFLIRAEILLARARFSPGVVDGRSGTNLDHALTAFKEAHNLPANGTNGAIDAQTWQTLSSLASRPVASVYTITQGDVAGPFAADVGEDFVKLAALPQGPLFTNVVEALAERFHMSQDLLNALNPGANFTAAGTRIIVVDAAAPGFAKGEVARIEVAKSDASLHAYDDKGKLIAFYPATVGSTERPSPTGLHKVVGVAWQATYTYDPAKLAWGPRKAGKLVVKPGPNNPVGVVWIDLNAPSYGIHGTPDPDNIGKTASHGCVRLTNWDATALAGGVKPGVSVQFMG